ncbi:MAG: tRNA (N(6)-L-threonylcarbamoyladenosine(37)-C(2))-methylthiotransferase MtaB [Microbacter sp.]
MIDPSQFQDKKMALYTLGCRLNFAETSTIATQLKTMGFRKIKMGEKADICIINTCTVTELADKKSRQAIQRLIRQHPHAFVVVTGCYAQLKPQDIAEIKGVDLVLGANEKFNVTSYLDSLNKKTEAQIKHVDTAQIQRFRPSLSHDDRTRFFLKVQDGCDYHCSYCTIPMARGASRNGSINDTLRWAHQALSEGAKEIVLTGVNIGDFGKSTHETFIDLLKALDDIPNKIRYRIGSIEPNLLTDQIIDFVSRSAHFTPHFHIPLQSGSNAMLKLMRRRYQRELFKEKVEMIRQCIPDAFIGVDVIVGMHGETAEEFENGYEFIQQLPISQLHVFTFSERANTAALSIENPVSMADRKKRSDRLHQLSNEKLKTFYLLHQGERRDVLWESNRKGKMMTGFTDNYIHVAMPWDKTKLNQFENVLLENFNDTLTENGWMGFQCETKDSMTTK